MNSSTPQKKQMMERIYEYMNQPASALKAWPADSAWHLSGDRADAAAGAAVRRAAGMDLHIAAAVVPRKAG